MAAKNIKLISPNNEDILGLLLEDGTICPVVFMYDPDLLGSMPFCVELDNLKDTDAPIHQPAAMLVAAD